MKKKIIASGLILSMLASFGSMCLASADIDLLDAPSDKTYLLDTVAPPKQEDCCTPGVAITAATCASIAVITGTVGTAAGFLLGSSLSDGFSDHCYCDSSGSDDSLFGNLMLGAVFGVGTGFMTAVCALTDALSCGDRSDCNTGSNDTDNSSGCAFLCTLL